MKNTYMKLALFIILCLGWGMKAEAQSTVTTSGFPLTINLSADVMSISLSSTPDVAFTYATAEDYVTEQTVTKPGHVTVVSNEPYNLSIAAQGTFDVTSTDETPLSLTLDVVQVNVDPATANGGTTPTVSLSTTGADIVTSSAATLGNAFDVIYTIPDATPLLNRAGNTYSTTLVYTATQL